MRFNVSYNKITKSSLLDVDPPPPPPRCSGTMLRRWRYLESIYEIKYQNAMTMGHFVDEDV